MAKSNIDLSKVKDLYDVNITKHGLNSKSVGWPNTDSQNLRFEKLLSVVNSKQEPFSINELGCGYGELFKYAVEQNFNIELFNGYDISSKMLKAAKQYLNDPRVVLIEDSNIHLKADYCITSGIFNVKFEEQTERWETYIQDTLVNMFDFANKGIAFNLLTSYVDFESPNLYYADPTFYFNFCKKNLSKYVNLIHDYNLYEWTITVQK